MAPVVSVIVPSLNGGATIGRCLEALATQRFDQPYEVIVVDDGSRDATPVIARDFGASVVTHPWTRGAAAARNSGAAAARAPVLAFVDDDCVPGPEWLDSLMAGWDHSGTAVTAIAGVTRPKDVDTLARRFHAFCNPLVPLEAELGGARTLVDRLRGYLAQTGSPPARGVRPGLSAVGANMSVRADAFSAVGGFEVDTPGGGEEEELCRRLRASFGPHTVMIHPEVVVDHDFAGTLRANLQRSMSYGFGAGVKWTKEGGLPSLRPAPLALALLMGLLTRRSAVVTIPLVATLPYCIFSGLARRATRLREPETLLYPWLALAHEASYDLGCAQGILWQWRAAPTPAPVALRRQLAHP